jgi:V/A-type H+-transporting ATPase subunit I
MLRPKEMERILVVGPKGHLDETIESLHALEAIHILDFHEPDDDFKLGQPLTKASEMSESLVKLRSISSVLEVEKENIDEKKESMDKNIAGKILTLELNINEEDSSRREIEDTLRDTKTRIDLLRPFAKLGLPFETYRGWQGHRGYREGHQGLRACCPGQRDRALRLDQGRKEGRIISR